MKERIRLIMEKAKMSQQDFANRLGISPASLSSIFTGRTNPTNNHVQAIHRAFPEININWLMFGEGDMYTTVAGETNGGDETEEREAQGHAAQSGKTPAESPSLLDISDPKHYEDWTKLEDLKEPESGTQQIPVVREIVKYVDKPSRKITEIRIFFDDGTFEVFSK